MAKKILCLALFLLFGTPAAARGYRPPPPRRHVPTQRHYASSPSYARLFIGAEAFVAGASLDESLKEYLADGYRTCAAKIGAKFMSGVPSSLSFFYQHSADETKERVFRSNGFRYVSFSSYKAYGIDGTLYFPVSDVLEVTFLIGSGYYEFTFSDNMRYYDGTEGYTAARIGAGLEYRLSDGIALNGFIRYADFDYDRKNERPFVKNMTETGVGITFYF